VDHGSHVQKSFKVKGNDIFLSDFLLAFHSHRWWDTARC